MQPVTVVATVLNEVQDIGRLSHFAGPQRGHRRR
jgi:hypothetical protein